MKVIAAPPCHPRARVERSSSGDSPVTPRNPAVGGPVELSGFQGLLEEIGLSSLLSILEMERLTGILTLTLLPGKKKARLYLRKGRVLRARRDGREEPRNAELVHELLDASRGTFDFRRSTVALGDEIRCSPAQLLLEGVRRLNEAIAAAPLKSDSGGQEIGARKERTSYGGKPGPEQGSPGDEFLSGICRLSSGPCVVGSPPEQQQPSLSWPFVSWW